ncbi:MAG TPA: peptide chain release factor 2, partial [Thermoanaerobaculia bacterium]|nr:peptide chain release factor 2 [Thermoanaerobaculia bacterium]
MTERDDLIAALKAASERLLSLRATFDSDAARSALDDLRRKASATDFWSRPEEAQEVLRQSRAHEKKLETAARSDELREELETFAELLKEGEPADADAREALQAAGAFADDLELSVKMGSPEDSKNAWLMIHAGAGGTESQDWAEMLLRMYMRFCENRGWKAELIDRQDGEEAGLKSATLHVVGDHAYGYLKSEMGVHRLVRISPFDAAQRRHTSFASIYVSPEVDEDIEVEINEKDLRVDTYRSSGAGGQHVNVTDSAVRITHLPTGIVVSCQNERSQLQNRATAMAVLQAKLLERRRQEEAAKMQALRGDVTTSWGNQIRNYVLHPYQLVKDLRTDVETGNVQSVLDGD